MIRRFFRNFLRILPFKKPVYSLLKRLGPPPESIYRHLYFNGPFDVKYQGKKVFKLVHHGHIEENEIFWNDLDNGWERKTISLWIELCRNKQNILDIGANTGLYGVCAKTFNNAANVHCFEPLQGVVTFLKQNAALNKLDLQVHVAGLSDYDGKADVFLPEEKEFVYSVTINQDTVSDSRKSRKVQIDVRRLDSMIREGLVPVPDLVKIDVERHEFEVLSGMKETLNSAKPDFILEVLDEEQANRLNPIFDGLGYLYFNIDDGKKSIRQTAKIEKSDYWNYLVCKPDTAKALNLI
jgi:FkbM family methyltransferase